MNELTSTPKTSGVGFVAKFCVGIRLFIYKRTKSKYSTTRKLTHLQKLTMAK